MDPDLASVQEARDLVARAAEAQRRFASADQRTVDTVVRAMAGAASAAAERLARLAVDETRMGVYEHKVLKNRFASDILLQVRATPGDPRGPATTCPSSAAVPPHQRRR